MDRPLCKKCNVNWAIRVKTDDGFKYRNSCDPCNRTPAGQAKKRKRPWHAFKKESCEQCGFVPEHPCQLSVDHIDGSKANNDPSNYKTLCHNCHTLKTYKNRDAANRRYA